MKQTELFSKFITLEIITRAIEDAQACIDVHKIPSASDRQNFHIVILGPKLVSTGRGYPNDVYLEPHLYHEESFGDVEDWRFDFRAIARCKALQLWDGTNPGGSQLNPPAHLLFSGDTPFYGGDKMEGLVCACSGLPPYYDKLVARVVLSSIIAQVHDALENSDDKIKGEPFLS